MFTSSLGMSEMELPGPMPPSLSGFLAASHSSMLVMPLSLATMHAV